MALVFSVFPGLSLSELKQMELSEIVAWRRRAIDVLRIR